MEVLLGSPTFSIEVPSENSSAVAETHNRDGLGFRESGSGSSIGENSSESSSIGVPDDDSDDDEVQSKPKEGGLLGLDSLEDALVIKGGLSRHFSGKSKSFANLSEVIQVKDLEKPDNPFNKRRRILMASKWSRKASFYSWRNPKSMPLLALNEDEEQQQQTAEGSDSEERNRESDEDDDQNERRRQTLGQRYHDRKLVNGFKSMSCFDLQEYEQQ